MTEIATVAVIGTGTKGTGIAEVFVRAGHPVILFDADHKAAVLAREAILKALTAMDGDGRRPTSAGLAGARALKVADKIDDTLSADVFIEAVAENLDVKRKVLAALEARIAPTALLTTNTGWLSVNAIGAGLKHPERFAGFHFLTPASVPLVEVIPAYATALTTIDHLVTIARRLGHKAVASADLPGFIVAHLNRGLMGEAARLLETETAPPHMIDAVLKSALSLKRGPFELHDDQGLDVMVRAGRQIFEGWGFDPRFRTVPLLTARLEAGLLGRAAGRGFYGYQEGRRQKPLIRELAEPWTGPVHVSPRHPDLAAAIRERYPDLPWIDHPSSKALHIVTPVGEDMLAAVEADGFDPRLSIGVDAIFIGSTITLAATPTTDRAVRLGAVHLFASTGATVAVVRDGPGLIAQRVAAMIVAVGYAMLDKGVSTAADIEAAAVDGLGYGQGPFALSRRIGLARTITLLESLQTLTGDARFRVPFNLRQVAAMERLGKRWG